VWFGEDFPLFAEIAARSAYRHNPRARVILLHEGLKDPVGLRARLPWLDIQPLSVPSLCEQAAERARQMGHAALNQKRLMFIWNRLSKPAARANLVRLLALYAAGGVYLDTDTLTCRSFTPLLHHSAFCGLERILWSRERMQSSRSYVWLQGPALSLLRLALARVPQGYRVQRKLDGFYTLAVNNAVLGARPGHPRLHQALQEACRIPERELTRPYRLGTHLLQSVLGTPSEDVEDVVLLPPEYFYPLGPVMSHHYFRTSHNAQKVAAELLSPETTVVHWYASVSNLLELDAGYITANRSRTPFAHLCAPYLDPSSEERGTGSSEAARQG